MISFGTNVISGMNGTTPALPNNATVDDQVPMQFDFRQVYGSILQDWFGLPAAESATILGDTFNTIPIFKKAQAPAGIDDVVTTTNNHSISIYPNPVSTHAAIQFTTLGGTTNISLYNDMGQLVRMVYENNLQAGTANINFERGTLATGQYYLVVSSGYQQSTAKLLVQ
jgi:hypothetical protein